MDVDQSQTVISFYNDARHSVFEEGVGPFITEHCPDNMSHGNHEQAAISLYSPTDESTNITKQYLVFLFQKHITSENFRRLGTLYVDNPSHKQKSSISTHGKGMQLLNCLANSVIYFNHNPETGEITESEHKIVRFYDEISKFINNHGRRGDTFDRIQNRNINENEFTLGDSKYKKSILCDFLQTYQGKLSIKANKGKMFNFCYFIELDDPDIIDKVQTFIDDDCKDIQIKNSQSNYNIFLLRKNDNKPYLLPTIDPTNYNNKHIMYLGCDIELYPWITAKGNKKQYSIIKFKNDPNKNSFYWNISESKPAGNSAPLEPIESSEKITIEIYGINETDYNEKLHSKYHGGWIILKQENEQSILVNTIPIPIDKDVDEPGGNYFKSIRIKVTIANMKYSYSDGKKCKSVYNKTVTKLINYIFRHVYKKTPEFQSKSFRGGKPVNENISITDKILIDFSRKKVNKSHKKPGKKSVKTEENTHSQQIRHDDPSGNLYLITYLDSDDWKTPNKQIIYKFGRTTKDDHKAYIKQHYKQNPTKKLTIIKHWKVNSVINCEQRLLKEFGKKNMIFNSRSTRTSEHIVGEIETINSIVTTLINNNQIYQCHS
tara:strand:+ start:2028 stop:3836 length:1809 start_codon:yes stop_codon:yes gene_type:complete